MSKNTEGFVDFIVRERMQQEFGRMQEARPLHKRETKDNLEKKFQKALEMLPPEQVKAVMEHYNSVFETGAENEEFFYRLGVMDGIRAVNMIKKASKSLF